MQEYTKLEPPAVKERDWIRTTYGKWARVKQVMEPNRIECIVADNRGNAYRRYFAFRNGWWRFERPDPDGFYLPHQTSKRLAAELEQGPPYRLLGAAGPIEYLHTQGTVWQPPRDLPSDET